MQPNARPFPLFGNKEIPLLTRENWPIAFIRLNAIAFALLLAFGFAPFVKAWLGRPSLVPRTPFEMALAALIVPGVLAATQMWLCRAIRLRRWACEALVLSAFCALPGAFAINNFFGMAAICWLLVLAWAITLASPHIRDGL